MTLRGRLEQHALHLDMGVAGNPLMVFRSLLMPNATRPPGLIQRYREELQARHYTHLREPSDES